MDSNIQQLEDRIKNLQAELETYKKRESENVYKTFISNSPDIIILVNEKYEYLFIHMPEVPPSVLGNLIGMDLIATTPECFRPKMLDALDKVFKQKETIIYESDGFAQGSYKYFLNYLTPILDDSGNVKQAYFVSRDITLQKLKENEVRELNLNLNSLFESLTHIYTVFDINQKILWFNKEAERLSNYFFHRPLELHLEAKDLFPSGIYESFNQQFNSALRGITIKYNRKFGNTKEFAHYFEMTLQPIYQGEEIIAIANVGVDITELVLKEEASKKVNEELSIQNQQLNQFSHIISHNLRSPITTLMGIANVIEEYKHDEVVVQQMLAQVSGTARKLDVIIQDLNYVLNQTGAEKAELQEVDMAELIEIIASLHRPNEFSISQQLEISTLYSIKSYLYSILFNLISNAIKYRKDGTIATISISSRKLPSDQIEILVKDEGIGMDMETVGDKLFGFYKRFHFHVEGKGLGLHITKKQLEYLGGTIEVESAIDKGCTFRIILPNQQPK